MKDKLPLESLQTYLQTILENIHESVWVVDTSYRIVWCNRRFSDSVLALFGYQLKEGDDALNINDSEEVKAFWKKRYDNCFAGKPLREIDTYSHPELVARVRITPIYEQAQIIGALCFSVNVKHDKDKDLALLHSQKQITETQRRQTELLSKISHEFRTPLNGIMGLVHILLHENPSTEQAEHLKNILATTEQLANITQRALDFIDISSNTFTLQEKPFSMHVLLKSMSQLFEPIAQEKNIRLDIKGSPEIPEVLYGDDNRITQVLEQLLNNALKFTEEGEVSLHAEVLPQEIHNLIVLQIKIKDTGIGIAPNKLTHIFDILYKTQDYKPSEKFLGLPLVKNLLEKLGGSIKVQSRLGQGSTFICEVPLKIIETKNKYVETNKNVVLDSLAGLRVLYVEDNMLNQRWIGKFLQNWHVSIDFASNGRQAVEKARQCAPEHFYHIVLMDLQMPEMDGYEAAKIMRTFTQIPIIALTASPPRSAKKQAFDVGMNDFISKPFPPELLHEKLREHTAYEYFVFLEKVQRKQLADFEAVVEFADGDLAYQQEMFSLYKKFFKDFVLLYEDAITKQDLAKLKTLAHKSRPSIKLLCLNSLEIELQNTIEALEAGENLSEQHLLAVQKIKTYCALCLAHLHAYSPEN